MYLVLRNNEGQVQMVYGYIPVAQLKQYVEDKYPQYDTKFEMEFPSDYTGEVRYLPEKDV